MREKGEPFAQPICDGGIERLRPVMITAGATILALSPLAGHGGPLWQPLCYAEIGGLAAATFITLVLVPVLYPISVLDTHRQDLRLPDLQPDAAPGRAQQLAAARFRAVPVWARSIWRRWTSKRCSRPFQAPALNSGSGKRAAEPDVVSKWMGAAPHRVPYPVP